MLLALEIVFTDDNPDKGTETKQLRVVREDLVHSFTDDNPDKETETMLYLNSMMRIRCQSLQMITPIRGRKQTYPLVT